MFLRTRKLVALAVLLAFAGVAKAQGSGSTERETGNAEYAEYIVKYRHPSAVMSMFSGGGVQMMDHHAIGQLYTIQLAGKSKIQKLIQLLTNPAVEYVVPNAKVKAFDIPVSDQALKEQWAIAKIQAEEAWKLAGNKGSKKVVVAVIDTGVDYKHKNLAPNMVPGYNFIQNN